MSIEIHDSRPESKYAFAVALIPCTPFPGPSLYEGEPFCVAACIDDAEGKWSFIRDLTTEERQGIGVALTEHGAQPRLWYWAIIRK